MAGLSCSWLHVYSVLWGAARREWWGEPVSQPASQAFSGWQAYSAGPIQSVHRQLLCEENTVAPRSRHKRGSYRLLLLLKFAFSVRMFVSVRAESR